MVDDPRDNRMPGSETVSILEVLANQIAIAIDNRVMYVQAKEQQIKPEPQPKPKEQAEEKYYNEAEEDDYTGGGLKKLVERFLR